MTCKGRVLHHSDQEKNPSPKGNNREAATIQVCVWWCYWDVESNLEAEPHMLQHQCFCSPVVSDVGCTCAEKPCSNVDNIIWCEGSNILKVTHNQGTGRSYNLLQTKLLVQCRQGDFLLGVVPVFVHWLFGADDKSGMFLVAVWLPVHVWLHAVRLQCSNSERKLESLIPHPFLLAGLHWYWAAALWGKREPEQFAVLRQRSCWLCNQLPAAFLGFCN